MDDSDSAEETPEANVLGSSPSETNSIADAAGSQAIKADAGVVVEINREVRLKLYMGQVRSPCPTARDMD